MKNRILFAFVVAAGMMLAGSTGCERSRYTEEIARLDRTLLSVDTAIALLADVDTALILSRKSQIEGQISLLNAAYKESGDTMTKGTALLISDYKGSTKIAKVIQKKYASTRTELKVTREQLETLRHDLKHNLLTEGQAGKYTGEEILKANAAVSNAKSIHSTSLRADDLYTRLAPKIDSLLNNNLRPGGV